MTQKDALEIMKMGYNVYLTGEAGTGKTYVLNQYIKYLRKKHIPLGITASTGIAATHIDGVTIDAWSGLGIRDRLTSEDLQILSQKYHLKKRVKETKVLIIDEISMIHGRRFDLIDQIVRLLRDDARPFGGLQIILCGDLFQLPPVSDNKQYTDFIFKSQAWNELNLQICYLDEAKRQTDPEFLQVLKDIRYSQVNQGTVEILKQVMQQKLESPIPPTKLYTHNVDVDKINNEELAKINDQAHFYSMSSLGTEALLTGMKRTCLAPEQLELKKGAVVMFVRNNYEKGYVNGTLGKVVGFDHHDNPEIETFTGNKITAEPTNWTISDENGKVLAQLVQTPLRLAWAITVHKSQGMTLDAAEVDLSKSFVEGMGYVALSRVRSLKGLKLLGMNQLALKVNSEVSNVDKQLVEFSRKTVDELNQSSVFAKWKKKREFLKTL